MNTDFIIQIFHYLQRFDTEYRTPEAHSAGGKMSKWTLPACSIDESPFEEFLLDAWNYWMDIDVMLGKMFGEEALRLTNAEIKLKEFASQSA